VSSTSTPWWASAVVYQIYPRSFQDSNGDGIGDLRGIIDRVDHLADLGIDVVWLSPIYASPQDDNGYDISDYRAIEPTFGSLDDFDELVARLHDAGIRLMMDLVVNHTSDEHAWFTDAASSRSSAKRDWYIWRPPRPGFVGGEPGSEPNNWRSAFSGSAWQFDEASGEYYLHLFSKKQPDLNWENEDVRREIYEMMRWWLDRGVDGFRMDVINHISKTPGLPDGEVAAGSHFGDGFPFYGYGPRLHDYLHEMNLAVFGDDPSRYITVGEMPGVTIEQARRFTDPARREVDMVFQFEHVGLDHGRDKFDRVPIPLPHLKRTLAAWQVGLEDVGWNSLYWGNHDQPRAVSRFGDDGEYRVESAKSLALVLHLMRGTPYVYQGEELGMTNAGFTAIEQFRDIESLNHYAEAVEQYGADPQSLIPGLSVASRDNARTPMQWADAPHAGFTTGEPWIAVTSNYPEVNAAAERADATSVFAFYRDLIAFRHETPVVVEGGFELLKPDSEQLFAYRRVLGAAQLTVVANFSTGPILMDVPAGEVVLATHPGRAEGLLLPWEGRAYLVADD
jgi:oligo-1,6-glucosidase